MKQILLALLFTVIVSFTFGQLQIRNNLTVPVRVSIGWYQQEKSWSGYVTRGWYEVYPGQVISPGLNFTSDNDYFLYYVEAINNPLKMTSGQLRMLIKPSSAFTIKNATLEYVEQQNKGVFVWKYFRRRDVHFKLLQERKYVFNININDIVN